MGRNEELYEASKKLLPGGVNSPVRAFQNVGLAPRFIKEARGCRFTDEDERTYIDYIGAYGPLILGHRHPRIEDALHQAIEKGTSFGAPTALELEMAKTVCSMVPSVEMVRMVNSGTEATLSAVRLARAVTGRDGIVKFAGCYHGHSDSFLIKAGSGALTMSVPDSPGVPQKLSEETLVARFNDLDSVETIFNKNSDRIAVVIVEPVAGNMGVVPPQPGFLNGLRELCTREGTLLVFDEVMTGFRVARGGAQELYGVGPDLTTLGKVIGGGLPVGAYGGSHELMEQVSPAGPVYQAGTLSGNPLAMSAGLAQLQTLEELKAWKMLESKAATLELGLRKILDELELDLTINRVGSMMTLFFKAPPVKHFESASESDTERHMRFFRAMLERGVHLPPSQYEAWFISLAHEESDLNATLVAARDSLQQVYDKN